MRVTPDSPDNAIPTVRVTSPSSPHAGGNKRSTARRLFSSLHFEIAMAWRITVGDFPNTVLPYTCLCIGTFAVSRRPLYQFPQTLLEVVSYSFLFIYAFTTVNQMISIDEDRANKPARPLASGIISKEWMVRRAVAANILFASLGLLSVPWPTVAWLALIQIHKFRGLYRHWFFKNVIFITLGAGVEFTATWGLVSPDLALPWRWICVTCMLAGIGCNAQDIRDVMGDRLVGRRTMSIAWGEDIARTIVAIFLVLMPVIQYGALRWPVENLGSIVAVTAPSILAWVSAVRFLLLRNPRSDNISFQIFCLWWCCALLLQPVAVISYGNW